MLSVVPVHMTQSFENAVHMTKGKDDYYYYPWHEDIVVALAHESPIYLMLVKLFRQIHIAY